MGDYDAPLSTHEAGRLVLAHIGLQASNELTRAIERAVIVSARTLAVERVSVWFFSEDATLRCLALYTLSTRQLTVGQVLDTKGWPAYCAALTSRKFIAADDARSDPRTRELTAEYLQPLGITSMLDAPVFRSGEVSGVVCHEHVGPARVWTEREREFAASVADILGTIFEQARALAAEEKLRLQQEQTARSARWEALGRLAGGVAHDFNGVLTVAMGTASIVCGLPNLPQEVRAQADELTHYADYGRRLVAQLSTFARQDTSPALELDIVEALGTMRPLLEASARDHKIDLVLPAAPLWARIGRSHLEQVAVNLVLNACDASPRGSHVRLEVGRELDAGASFAALRVTDQGPGIDPAQRERLFEPFFTTKGADHGGMGLAIVHGIALGAGGGVYVESEPTEGAGSTFVVRLPEVQP